MEAERGGARYNDRERWRELDAVCKCRVLTQFVWRQCVMKCDKTSSSLSRVVTDTAAALEKQLFAIGLKLIKPSVWMGIKQSLADRDTDKLLHFERELRILRSRKHFFFFFLQAHRSLFCREREINVWHSFHFQMGESASFTRINFISLQPSS